MADFEVWPQDTNTGTVTRVTFKVHGKHWEFYGTEDRAYVRYGVRRGRRMISVGHWLSHGFAPIQAALVMNRAHDKPLTDHQIVCLLVRKDMQKWDENRTKDKFRKIVRPTHDPEQD